MWWPWQMTGQWQCLPARTSKHLLFLGSLRHNSVTTLTSYRADSNFTRCTKWFTCHWSWPTRFAHEPFRFLSGSLNPANLTFSHAKLCRARYYERLLLLCYLLPLFVIVVAVVVVVVGLTTVVIVCCHSTCGSKICDVTHDDAVFVFIVAIIVAAVIMCGC